LTDEDTKYSKNRNSFLTDDQLLKLKKRLPHGSYQQIAKETGLSKSYVTQVLGGTRWNKSVILKAREIILRHEEEIRELTNF